MTYETQINTLYLEQYCCLQPDYKYKSMEKLPLKKKLHFEVHFDYTKGHIYSWLETVYLKCWHHLNVYYWKLLQIFQAQTHFVKLRTLNCVFVYSVITNSLCKICIYFFKLLQFWTDKVSRSYISWAWRHFNSPFIEWLLIVGNDGILFS